MSASIIEIASNATQAAQVAALRPGGERRHRVGGAGLLPGTDRVELPRRAGQLPVDAAMPLIVYRNRRTDPASEDDYVRPMGRAR